MWLPFCACAGFFLGHKKEHATAKICIIIDGLDLCARLTSYLLEAQLVNVVQPFVTTPAGVCGLLFRLSCFHICRGIFIDMIFSQV